MYLMKRIFLGALLAVVSWGGLGAQDASGRAVAELQELVNIQRELLVRASEAELPEQVEALRPRLQSLVFDFERFLREHPKLPEGYISYSMLLGNPLLDERERAKALLLKANSLDANLPIVKNQLGKYLAEDGLPLDAVNYFLAAVELRPEEPLYHFQLGQLLGAARDDFLKSGEWTVAQIDRAMMEAFAEAVRLDPDNLPYAYRQAEAYYDLQTPPWDEALEKWGELVRRVETAIERQMMGLHRVNIMLYQGQLDTAEAMLIAEVAEPLAGQKQRLVERLERLRKPLMVGDAGSGAEAGEKAAVPEFKPGVVDEPAALDSAATVELAKERKGEPEVNYEEGERGLGDFPERADQTSAGGGESGF